MFGLFKKETEKTHAEKCASKRCKYDGDMRIMSNFMMGDCDCDGYHTFSELYEHRTALFIALCHNMRAFAKKSRVHEDGTMFDGMFIATLQTPNGQISYHLENKHWEELDVQEATEPWDKHTSDDVIERLKKLQP